MQDSICGQSDNLSSSEDSFCLQLQLQSTQVQTKIPALQHLITNLAYKLKPHHKKTQYLSVKIRTLVQMLTSSPLVCISWFLLNQIVQSFLLAAN